MENENKNPYSVYILFDKLRRSQEEVAKLLESFSPGNNNIIHIRKCADRDDQDNRYICCMRKEFNDYLENQEQLLIQNGLNVRRYRNRVEKLKPGLTHGYYINTAETNPQDVIDVFKHLELSGFIRPHSYNIIYPKPYPNGTERNYLIVTFERVNGFLPKNFIRKLRALLNQSIVNNKLVNINWLSYSVLRDIEKGSEKDRFVKQEGSLSSPQNCA